eukprot:1317007-Rhodomonas_salina.1
MLLTTPKKRRAGKSTLRVMSGAGWARKPVEPDMEELVEPEASAEADDARTREEACSRGETWRAKGTRREGCRDAGQCRH